MHERCELCGGSLLGELEGDLSIDHQVKIEHRRNFCPECLNKLNDIMTYPLVNNFDVIEETINTIEQAAQKKDGINRLRSNEREKIHTELAYLKELLEIGDGSTDEAFQRRNNIFVMAKFTYDRINGNIPQAIENSALVTRGRKNRETAPWKMRHDEGETTSTEGHSRAVVVVEVDPEARRISGRELIKFSGLINGANGDWRENCQVQVVNSVPDWYWIADWGVNTIRETEEALERLKKRREERDYEDMNVERYMKSSSETDPVDG